MNFLCVILVSLNEDYKQSSWVVLFYIMDIVQIYNIQTSYKLYESSEERWKSD